MSAKTVAPLYPPTVKPADGPLPVHRFIYQFVRNPLRSLPRDVYLKPIVVHSPTIGKKVAWITGPSLTEQILRDRTGLFVKTELEKRVFNPILGQSVLVAEGPHWLWQRRVMAPLFRHSEILSYVPRMAEAALDQVEQWRATGDGWRAIDTDMVDVTFTVIANTMLSGGEPEEGATLKRSGARYLAAMPWEMAHTILKAPRWLPHPGTFAMRRCARTMREAASSIISRQRARADVEQRRPHDLLGRLVAARDPETGMPMSDDQLVDNLLTLLEAGHETTARALTWTLYLLARAPEWQERVRAEVATVAGKDPITAAHVERFGVAERVIKESMRLYPPAPVVARSPTEAVELGGHRLEAETELIIPIFAVHRHRTLWDDPDRFDPDRFVPEQADKLLRTQYMPFGAGPRICLGMSFAMVEAKTLLAIFVRAMRFGWDGKAEPEPLSRVTLRPRGGIRLRVSANRS
jgi:cytochrome P450